MKPAPPVVNKFAPQPQPPPCIASLNSLYTFWNNGEFGFGCLCYFITMLLIIYDDIVLMHYLRKRITNYKAIKN